MFSTTTMGSSTTNPTAMVSPHQRDVVEAEVEHEHRRERTEQRQRRRDAGNEGRPEIAQKKQHDHYNEADGQYQGKLDVVYRRANRHGAVEQGLDFHRRRNI